MTKRQFDAKTKWNAGSRMASDTRAQYRSERGRGNCFRNCYCQACRLSVLERRAAYGLQHDHAALAIASPLRAPAALAAHLGRSAVYLSTGRW